MGLHPYPLTHLTRASKVHNPHCTSLGVTEKDVLRLEVTVNDLNLRSGEKEEGCAQLLGKLACQVQRDASKVGVAKQFVEVIGEKFKDQTEMVTIHKVTLHPN